MNQERIRVTLSQDGENDLLTFDIKENAKTQPYIVNLSDSAASQTQLKRIFSRLLTLLVEKDLDIILELEIEKGFSKNLQKEVSEEYIDSLNGELSKVKESIRSEFSKVEQSSGDNINEDDDDTDWELPKF